MISFSSPIIVNFPQPNVVVRPPINVSELDYSVTYDNDVKTATARIKQLGRNLILWSGQDYLNQGQFTDAMVDAQVSSLLGSNPQSVLEGLIKGIQPYIEPVEVATPEATPVSAPEAIPVSAPEDTPVSNS